MEVEVRVEVEVSAEQPHARQEMLRVVVRGCTWLHVAARGGAWLRVALRPARTSRRVLLVVHIRRHLGHQCLG